MHVLFLLSLRLVGRHVFVAIRTITLRIVLFTRLGEARLHCPRVIRALQIVARNEGSIVVGYECVTVPGCDDTIKFAANRRGARCQESLAVPFSNVIHSLERKDDC